MAHIAAGGVLIPDVGDVLTWDGEKWVPAPPPAPTTIIAGGRGGGGGGGRGATGAAGAPGPAGPAGPPGPSAGAFAGCTELPPTATLAQDLEALITLGEKFICLGEGTYSLERTFGTALTPAQLSGVQITGAGDDRTVVTTALPLPILFQLAGAPDGTVVTTLAAGVPAIKGTRTMTLTSAAGVLPGMVLSLFAHNLPGNPTDQAGMSDGVDVFLTEIVEVESVALSVVTDVAQFQQWHTPGAVVESVEVVEDVLIRGIFFDCAGGDVGTAISATLARRVQIDACSFRGFSDRAILLAEGARDVQITKFRSRGENNSLIDGDSAMSVLVDGLQTDKEVPRSHANGEPWWMINLMERCADWQVTNSVLQHGNGGIRLWGGTDIQLGPGLKIRDMDPSAIRARNPAYPPGAIMGVSLEGSAGPLNLASFAFGVQFLGVEMEDTFGDDAAWAWHLHDVRNGQIDGCGIWCSGPAYGTIVNGVTFTPQGMRINDVQAIADSLQINGCSNAIVTTGTPQIQWGHLKLSGQAGNYVGATIPILFDHGGASGMRFDSLYADGFNTAAVFSYGANFIGNPDYTLRIGYMNRGGLLEATELTCYATDAAFAFGAVAEIVAGSPNGTKHLAATGGPSAHNAGVFDPAGAGSFTFASGLPASLATLSVLGAGNAGDILEANAANQAVVNNAAAPGTKIGRLLVTKTAAGAALALVGSVD